jgi:hypothetical protein
VQILLLDLFTGIAEETNVPMWEAACVTNAEEVLEVKVATTQCPTDIVLYLTGKLRFPENNVTGTGDDKFVTENGTSQV